MTTRSNWNQIANGAVYDFATGEITGDYNVATHARVLSRIPRYNSQTDTPFLWPVGAHVCLVTEILAAVGMAASPMILLQALRHDDHEVITGDTVQPLKQELRLASHAGVDTLDWIARRAQTAIAVKHGISRFMGDEATARLVKAADIAACDAERRILFTHYIKWDLERIVDDSMFRAAQRILETDYKPAEVDWFGKRSEEKFLAHTAAIMARIV